MYTVGLRSSYRGGVHTYDTVQWYTIYLYLNTHTQYLLAQLHVPAQPPRSSLSPTAPRPVSLLPQPSPAPPTKFLLPNQVPTPQPSPRSPNQVWLLPLA